MLRCCVVLKLPFRRGGDNAAHGLGHACFGLKSFLVGAVIERREHAGDFKDW